MHLERRLGYDRETSPARTLTRADSALREHLCSDLTYTLNHLVSPVLSTSKIQSDGPGLDFRRINVTNLNVN